MRISDWSSDVCSSDLRIDRCALPIFGGRTGVEAAAAITAAVRQVDQQVVGRFVAQVQRPGRLLERFLRRRVHELDPVWRKSLLAEFALVPRIAGPGGEGQRIKNMVVALGEDGLSRVLGLAEEHARYDAQGRRPGPGMPLPSAIIDNCAINELVFEDTADDLEFFATL